MWEEGGCGRSRREEEGGGRREEGGGSRRKEGRGRREEVRGEQYLAGPTACTRSGTPPTLAAIKGMPSSAHSYTVYGLFSMRLGMMASRGPDRRYPLLSGRYMKLERESKT